MPRSPRATTSPITATDPIHEAAELTGFLRILADPTRLRIFLALREGEMCVCELAAALGFAENLVSHHLGVLRRSGMVEDRRDPTDARWVYYHLNAERLAAAYGQISAILDPRGLKTRIPLCGPAAPPQRSRGSRA